MCFWCFITWVVCQIWTAVGGVTIRRTSCLYKNVSSKSRHKIYTGLARADKIINVWSTDFWIVRSRTIRERSGAVGPSTPQDRPVLDRPDGLYNPKPWF